MITLTNLIPSPSMEGNGWNGTYSTEHSYVGTRSLKMSGASGSAETTCSATASIPLIPSHTYYARVYGYQDSKTNGAAVGFYWPIAEPNFNDNLPVGDAGKWKFSHGAEMVSILGTVIPAVKSAVITPNPTAINQSIKISISVYEQIIILYPEVFNSGEIQSGEV